MTVRVSAYYGCEYLTCDCCVIPDKCRIFDYSEEECYILYKLIYLDAKCVCSRYLRAGDAHHLMYLGLGWE
jgi:hypothetical protein